MLQKGLNSIILAIKHQTCEFKPQAFFCQFLSKFWMIQT
jgi:hypothetical protein